jgi:hypothetical protein
VRRLLLPVLCAGVLSGCGFVHASDVSHTKPSGFVLRGHVTVPLSGSATASAGSACTAPAAAPDIVLGATVTVTDGAGRKLAVGSLGAGVLAAQAGRDNCEFPFQIPGVPGGVDTYRIAVARRAPQTFPATPLRQGETAILTVSA